MFYRPTAAHCKQLYLNKDYEYDSRAIRLISVDDGVNEVLTWLTFYTKGSSVFKLDVLPWYYYTKPLFLQFSKNPTPSWHSTLLCWFKACYWL